MATASTLALRSSADRDHTPALVSGAEAVTSAIEQIKSLRTFINAEMIPGVDYGAIPGTTKKTLLLPGAQKTALYFNTAARFRNERIELGNGHLEVISRCHLVSRGTNRVLAEGFGSCSTMESKYRWRNGERCCPECGKATIIKGKEEYGGGWVCFGKKGGCGAKFSDRDRRIADQNVGRAENPDIYDQRNTVLKMAMKRGEVAAALALGAMAELFTQDLEDFIDLTPAPASAPTATESRPAPSSDRDAARQAINEQFRTAEPPSQRREPQRRSEPTPEPEPTSETWAQYSARKLKTADDEWVNEQAVQLRISKGSRLNLDTNVYRMTQHLVSTAIATPKDDGSGPLVCEDAILGPNGKRDRVLVNECADWLKRSWPEWVDEVMTAYLAGKASESRAALLGDREPGSDG